MSETGPGEMMGNAGPGMLAGLRVIEVADERAEYTGLLLAGLGIIYSVLVSPGRSTAPTTASDGSPGAVLQELVARVDNPKADRAVLWQEFAIGVLIIVAVALDQWIRRVSK